MQKYLWCKKVQPSKVESYLEQDRRNVFRTGPAKLDPKDYAIKCVGAISTFYTKMLKNHAPLCLLRT